jgi:Zn-dependent protease
VFGIEIGVHYSWVFAFALITWSLAHGFFPLNFPGWAGSTYWAAGALASLLLFLSVLVHEMAHSLVALARGLAAHGITLFIFGGVSNIEADAARARDEFWVAVAGPATSLALGVLFWSALQLAGGSGGPLEGILFYLALVNGLLAAFNLLPGFPLDGGRILRSAIWGASGNFRRATRVASAVGQGLGWGMVGLGGLLLWNDQALRGVWMGVLGWFLNNAAVSARRETAIGQILHDVPVSHVMDPEPTMIAADATVEALVREWPFQRGHGAVIVCDGRRPLGIVSFADVRGVPQELWAFTLVSEVMVRAPLVSVAPDFDLSAALRLLATHELNQVVVLRDGLLVGVVSRADVLRHLHNREEPGEPPLGGR